MATTIRPFRDVDEHDVINLYKTRSGTMTKGMLVKIVSGFVNDNSNWVLGADPTAQAYGNTVSPRWSVPFFVDTCNSGDKPIGMLLYDVKETDENGERLYYHPRKAAELQCVISGQAVPLATRGIFLYSGVAGFVTAGNKAYSSAFGEISVSGTSTHEVGVFLGPKDSNGHVLVKLDL